MLFLLISIIFSSSFGIILKFSQERNHDVLAVGATNYVTAALASLFSLMMSGHFAYEATTSYIGVLGGVAYVTSFMLIIPVLRRKGISIPFAVVRLSVLIPIVCSIFLWREEPNVLQVTGIGLACLSLALLSAHSGENNEGANSNKGQWPMWLLISALFFTTGGCGLAAKAFQESGFADQKPAYFAFLFGTAAVVSTAALARQRTIPRASEMASGIVLGLCNVLGNFSLVFALESLPGTVVFPISSSMGVVLTTLCATTVWSEKLERKAIVGVVVAVLAVVCINLR